MEVKGFGVSNLVLKCFFKNNWENLSNNFVGVSPADEKKEFIKEIQHNDKAKYPFLVANTDLHKRPGVHWWSFLDADKTKNLFVFDSFGTYRLQKFIVDNDLDIFQKFIPGQIKQIFKQQQDNPP